MDIQQRLIKAKDTRTDEEFQKQYEIGHYNEEIVYHAMKCPKFRLNTKKFIGDGGQYEPDCFMFLHRIWLPVEIKTSRFPITTADFKAHQVSSLVRIDGVILFATSQKMTILRAVDIEKSPLVSAGESKLGHESYRCKLTNWAKWDKILYFK